MATLSAEMQKQIAEAVTTAATATEKLLTEKVEGIARQVAHVEAASTGAIAAKQYCSTEVANTARQAADAAAQQRFEAGLARIEKRCDGMSDSLQRAGVVEASNRTAMMESLQRTAQQMADTRYTQHNFFFKMANWPGDCVKARNLTIRDAVGERPTPLDDVNHAAWFTKVFDLCQGSLPASTPLQRVDVMWASLPAEQACLWFAEVREVK